MADALADDALTFVPDDPGATRPPDFSSMSVRQLRDAHERAATQDIGRHLSRLGLEVAELRPGRAAEREPDAVFISGDRTIGIELTCVGYYERGSRQAGDYMRSVWSDLHELLIADGPTVRMGPELMNFDHVRTYVQSLLDQKCAKEYSVPTILVICAVMGHVGLTTAEDGPAIVGQIRVPAGCPFDQIYLRMQRDVTGEIELFSVG